MIFGYNHCFFFKKPWVVLVFPHWSCPLMCPWLSPSVTSAPRLWCAEGPTGPRNPSRDERWFPCALHRKRNDSAFRRLRSAPKRIEQFLQDVDAVYLIISSFPTFPYPFCYFSSRNFEVPDLKLHYPMTWNFPTGESLCVSLVTLKLTNQPVESWVAKDFGIHYIPHLHFFVVNPMVNQPQFYLGSHHLVLLLPSTSGWTSHGCGCCATTAAATWSDYDEVGADLNHPLIEVYRFTIW